MKKKKNSLIYKSLTQVKQIKRFVFDRRGDGVHSPYAFNLITKVIRNPYPYDCFRFLSFDHKILSLSIKEHSGDRLVHRFKTAELIFRLALNHTSKDCILISQRKSLLIPYLERVVKHVVQPSVEEFADMDTSALLIVEDCPLEQMENLKMLLLRSIEEQGQNLMIVFNHNNPLLRKNSKSLAQWLNPPISFHLKHLKVFVWRAYTTPGSYNVYS